VLTLFIVTESVSVVIVYSRGEEIASGLRHLARTEGADATAEDHGATCYSALKSLVQRWGARKTSRMASSSSRPRVIRIFSPSTAED